MRIVICSGAGLSAESGIPTFRSNDGLWEQYSLEEVCNIHTFEANYIKVNEFYNKRRSALATVEPNLAHYKIAELAALHDVINLTTNVDDLLERAGCDDVIHIHGELTKVRLNYGTESETIQDVQYKEITDQELLDNFPVKPFVVFFGEQAPLYKKLHDVMQDLTTNDIVIIVGSSEQVVNFVNGYLPLSYHTPPQAHFVNNDPELCTKLKRTSYGLVKVHQMTAVEFFRDKVDEIIKEVKNKEA